MSERALAIGDDIGTTASPRRVGRRRYLGPSSLGIGLGVLAVILASSALATLFGIVHPTRISYTETLQPPSMQHWFGTDALGRDVFDRTLAATLLDVRVGIITVVVPMLLGLLVGARVGYVGGVEESIVMRLMDILLALPFLIFVLAIVAISGPGLKGVYAGLIVGLFPVFVRITRGEMLVLREQQFLLAATTLGYSRRRIVVRHAMPLLIRPNLVFAMAAIVGNITALAALSYLGVGVQPPAPEWGAIIAEGQPYLLSAWWISTLPGLFMVLVCVAIYIVGEALADRLNVHMSGVV